MITRVCAAVWVAAIFMMSAAGGIATGVPRPTVDPVPLSAAPVGPAEPTEQRTNCAVTTDYASSGPPVGHRLLDVAAAHRFSTGAGVKVAVIDTGVSPHPRLRGLIPGGDYVGSGDGLTDCDAHGTLVAGIIAGQPSADDDFVGVAPAATIIAIRQSSGAYSVKGRGRGDAVVGAGYGPIETLARAVVRAVDLGADVINISEVACSASGDQPADTMLGAALAHARSRDAVVVVAAGNIADTTACREQNPSGWASPEQAWAQIRTSVTPARFAPLVLAVGAVDGAGTPASFSLRGPWVGVGAPGTDIVSLAPGAGRPRLVGGLRTADGASGLAGTSYAAPYVAGLAALIRSRFPDLSAAEVSAHIVRTAHGGGDDAAVGGGVIDLVAALSAAPETGSAQGGSGTRAFPVPAPPQTSDSGVGTVIGGSAFAGAALIGVWLTRRRR